MTNQYNLSELIKRWEREQLTVEQAIGQILLWLVALSRRVEALEAGKRAANKPH